MRDIIAIGEDVFINYFAIHGFSTFKNRGKCEEIINFINSTDPHNKMFILSKDLGEKCLIKLEKILREHGSIYVILPELKKIPIDEYQEQYDRIIKTLIGL